MKKIFSVFVLLVSFCLVKAQRIAPAAYSSSAPVNYVRTWDAKAPQSDASKILVSASVDSFIMTTQYLDGLGRPIQTVVKGLSPLGKDLVTPVIYDEYGREQYKYLPFAANTTGGNSSTADGLFKLNPFQQDSAFYQTNNTVSPIKGQGETYFYSQSVFEASPLNRVLNNYAPGNSWVGNSKGIGQLYLINTVADSVRIWNVININYQLGSFAPYASPGIYPAGQLFKTITEDENGKQVIEFKDKEGKIVLKKVQLMDNINGTSVKDDGAGRAHDGWICTYYIYDDLGLLRCVIQPEGVNALASNGWNFNNLSVDIFNEQLFRYEYNQRNRMIIKKIPGAEPVYMVYDERDRLVFIQDGNNRLSHHWLTTIYDQLNRPVITGMMTYNSFVSTSQEFQNLITYCANPANPNGTSTIYTQGSSLPGGLTVMARQTSGVVYEASSYIEFTGEFETEPTAEFIARIAEGSAPPTTVTVAGSPIISGATFLPLTFSYFDDYTFTSKVYSNNNNSKLSAGNNSFVELLPVNNSSLTRGLSTGSKVWVMESTNLSNGRWLETANFFDDKGRVLQTQSDNVAGGKDTLTSMYDFSGKVVSTYISHANPGGNIPAIQVRTNNNYDVGGRLISVQKRINDKSATDKTVAILSYDEIGQLKKKVFGSSLDSMEYDYNIRGWMLGANRNYAKSTSSTSHYFGFDLGYDKRSLDAIGNYADSMFNGNIAGMLWKSTGDDEIRKYDFTYDALNRLTGADFNQYTSSSFNKTAKVDFSVKNLSYDANGNILFMNQKGWKVGGSVTIDSLAYGYNTLSNKLKYVSDRANDTLTKLGDFKEKTNNTSQDYNYDDNGSLTLDNNKGIANIHYNHLNLPDSITVTGKGTIKYVYDATGNKLKKITTEASKVTTTMYLFGNYVNDTLQYLPQEEGRVRYNTDSARFECDYYVKDHLGNVRMVLTEANKRDAYPMASMEIADTAVQNALYYNLNATRYPVGSISGYPTDNTTSPNEYVAKTNGSGNKIGPAIVLKVMAGDKFNLMAKSWYKKNGATLGAPNSPVADLVSALTNSIGTVVGSHATTTELSSTHAIDPGVLSFYGSHNTSDSTTKPKAFVNWVLFDEQFNYVGNSSGFEQVGVDNTLTTHQQNNLPINKNGYLYVYVSNETPNIDVFFDNLQVTHLRGPLLEETHYYPFGLVQQGISSKAMAFGGAENKRKFNGANELQSNEFSDGSGLEMYDAVNRMYDPQLGRFGQVDELAESNFEWTPYNFAVNNPILRNDPFGLQDSVTANGEHVLANVTHPEVVVVGIPKGFWAKQRLYYNIMSSLQRQGASIDQIQQDDLREMMYRYDAISRNREAVAASTRAGDEIFLEAASWFIPMGELTKLRYLKYATNLFKLKRGIHYTAGAVDLTTQLIVNKGDIRKVNLVSTASSTLIGNPFLSTVPGAFANLSISNGLQLNSASDFNVYKNIVLSTAGNVGGDKLGLGLKNGSTIPGGQFIGETFVATGASVLDEMTNTNRK